jgi:hypothetical protein
VGKKVAGIAEGQRASTLELSPYRNPQTRTFPGQAENEEKPRRRERFNFGYGHYIDVIHITNYDYKESLQHSSMGGQHTLLPASKAQCVDAC